jgi:hypothetical protein
MGMAVVCCKNHSGSKYLLRAKRKILIDRHTEYWALKGSARRT